MLSTLTKQKINTMSSTQTEMVAILDDMPKNIMCLYFTKAQGVNIKDNLLHKDNASTINWQRMK